MTGFWQAVAALVGVQVLTILVVADLVRPVL